MSEGGDAISRERGPSALREDQGSSGYGRCSRRPGLSSRRSRCSSCATRSSSSSQSSRVTRPSSRARSCSAAAFPRPRAARRRASARWRRRAASAPRRAAGRAARSAGRARRARSRVATGLVHGAATCAAGGAARASRRESPSVSARRRLDHVERGLGRRLGGGGLLGLRRAAARRPSPPASRWPLRRAYSGSRSFQIVEQRRRDEDRRVGTRGDADEQREREVLQRRAAEEEQRARPAAA